MFIDKVGSDACLVLNATATLSGSTITYTVEQKFDFEELVAAFSTRSVLLKVNNVGATLKAAFGDMSIAHVIAVTASNKHVYIAGCSFTGTVGVSYITKNADTGVWSGTASI